jgi:hypothetical protein
MVETLDVVRRVGEGEGQEEEKNSTEMTVMKSLKKQHS